MEEKESTFSGSLSPGNSETESPPAPMSEMVPQVVHMDGERVFGGTTMAATISVAQGSGGGGAMIVSGDLLGKKKRGRPRKYDADGNLRVAYQGVAAAAPPHGFSLSPSSPSDFSSKKGRGRPSGSGNWQLLASLAGGDFTPHVVTVNTGEDVAGKILSFSQKGSRGICVLSANGAVSNVTIRQPGSSGGILTYEGRFEILSLSGSFTVTESAGIRSRTGGLSVSLAGPDGRVIGGGIAGLLMAASPIQIVVGSFMPNGSKTHKRKHNREYGVSSPVVSSSPDAVAAARPISQANPAGDINRTDTSPFPGHINGEADRSMNDKHNLNTPTVHAAWNFTDHASDQRPSPDINVSVSCAE